MRKVSIVTDSASGIPEGTAEKLCIKVIPMQIVKGGEAFTVGRDITSSEVYEAMRQGSILKTSQPLVPHIEEAYTEALKESDKVISVHISSKLTSTASTCRMVADMVAPGRIEVIDSSSLTMMYGLACIKAAKRAAAGCGAEEVRAVIMDVLSRVKGWLAVPSLRHLSHSGRVSKALRCSLRTNTGPRPRHTGRCATLRPKRAAAGPARWRTCMVTTLTRRGRWKK